MAELKPLNSSMQSLIQRTKAVGLNQNDVDSARNICTKLNALYSTVLEEAGEYGLG